MPSTSPSSAGRSRPAAVQRRGVERTQALLDAAETLLSEQGYAAAASAAPTRTRFMMSAIILVSL